MFNGFDLFVVLYLLSFSAIFGSAIVCFNELRKQSKTKFQLFFTIAGMVFISIIPLVNIIFVLLLLFHMINKK